MKIKTKHSIGSNRFAAAMIFLGALPGLQAASFVADFNSGLPGGCSVYGDAAALASGGYTNGGYLQLTPDAGSKAGSFVITNDLDAGAAVVSFTASFKVLIGGGDRFGYGDGMSFDFAPDVPLAADGLAEQGVGSGLRVGMRTTKDSTLPNPAITVSGAGTTFTNFADDLRANTFVDMVVQLNPDTTLSVIYDGVYVLSNVPLGYTPAAGSLFWIGARTGGAHEKHFIDNLKIATRTDPTPYIKSFAPRGRQVSPTGPLDVVLTDYRTQVNTNSISLTLDGAPVSRTITQDGSGNTTVHFATGTAFATSSKHSVSVAFTDSAARAQSFSWEFTVAEKPPTNFVTIFSDDFEKYLVGALDKNLSGAPNAAPNGSGNPWFGPYPDNFTVLGNATLVVAGTNVNVTPHSGAKMIRKSYQNYLCTLWLDLAYRCHSGQPLKGNCRLDWWFFDANDPTPTNTFNFFDYISLYYYNSAGYSVPIPFPYTADWPVWWGPELGLFWENDFTWGDNDFQSLSSGGSRYNQNGGYYDAKKYQVRLEEMATGVTYGIDGWINTIPRTQGWHHSRILLGPPHANGTVMVYF